MELQKGKEDMHLLLIYSSKPLIQTIYQKLQLSE